MRIDQLDHLVLTVADLGRSINFYSRVLGMQRVTFGANRHALIFGESKINLHEVGHELMPSAQLAAPGTADLCFVTSTPIAQVVIELTAASVPIELGPIGRAGACGPIWSVYVRDPDCNLIEISNYLA